MRYKPTKTAYQPKTESKYCLPHDLDMRTIYLVRGYDRIKLEHDSIPGGSPAPPDGMPRGQNIGHPTEREALKMAALLDDLRAVEKSLEMLPPEYRRPVFENVAHRARASAFPMSRRTMSRMRAIFLWNVAWRKGWI